MPPEEAVLAVALIVLGLLRVIPAIVLHQHFGGEVTIALMGFVAGMWWGLRWRRRARRDRRSAS